MPPTSFEQVGSIVHVNLDDALLPYKYVIGQVLLDKVPSCRTVVNKVGKIVSPWRTFDMEVLAGEKDTHVTVREGSCVYSFDYSKVYWNARLHREHLRLVDSFSRSDVVADMFCGVGPFALPAAKRGCRVFANDLNPNCFAALRDNIRRNHVGSVASLRRGGTSGDAVQHGRAGVRGDVGADGDSRHPGHYESPRVGGDVLRRVLHMLRGIASPFL